MSMQLQKPHKPIELGWYPLFSEIDLILMSAYWSRGKEVVFLLSSDAVIVLVDDVVVGCHVKRKHQ